MIRPHFRVWDIKNKLMLNLRLINFEESYVEAYDGDWYRFDEVVLIQSTGLKDKYGVEIYESDIIVNHVGDVWVITYFRGAFRYYPIESYSKDKEKLFETDNIGNFGTEAFEVIGNIYADKYLMDVTE